MKETFQDSTREIWLATLFSWGFLGPLIFYAEIRQIYDLPLTILVIIWIVGLVLGIRFIIFIFPTIILLDNEMIFRIFGKEKHLPYDSVIDIYDSSSGLSLFTEKEKFKIARAMDNYPLLYNILNEKIPVFQEKDQQAFPWKLTPKNRKAKDIVFDVNRITITGEENITFAPTQIQEVRIDSYSIRYSNHYELVIEFKNKEKIIIKDSEARNYGYALERTAANLHTLYPFIKPSVTLSESEKAQLVIEEADRLYEVGEFATAVNHYKQATETDPLNHHLWQRLGICLLSLEEYEEAGKAFRQAVMLDNQDAKSYFHGAIAFHKSGNELLARLYSREAQNLDPNLQIDPSQVRPS